ncbi:DinB family protein [Neobacillus sp. MER 74]|uniref:DinB family protein n=1 Tax=Bacillaceae TaxID=186817 RepID=UPI000BF9E063|nr:MULTISPECIES: DinB family protein [Bacillaceae]MCM3117970.1 DinB family protein [Neobacillus sp. MER 74]PFP17578.1 formate dehydrogenase [Bacillus sp. AFS073361]
MSKLLFKHFELIRGRFVNFVGDLEEGTAGIQPNGFNNTIHWHVGHVLTVAEQFMFGFPKKTTQLPANYMQLFATGTSPAAWEGDVPSVQELIIQLQDQLARIKEIPVESFNQRLKTPFLGQETFGELANFALFHEGIHLGQMQAMKRIIKANVN